MGFFFILSQCTHAIITQFVWFNVINLHSIFRVYTSIKQATLTYVKQKLCSHLEVSSARKLPTEQGRLYREAINPFLYQADKIPNLLQCE